MSETSSRVSPSDASALMARARGGPCQVHSNIVKVQVADDRIYYPYLIVDQRRRRIDRHWRDVGEVWQWEESLVEGEVPVPCIDTAFTLDEIYLGVDLPRVAEPNMVEYEV